MFYRLLIDRVFPFEARAKIGMVWDIGCRNWSYAPALATSFPNAKLAGVEVDARNHYWSLYRRKDLAEAYALHLRALGKEARFYESDFRRFEPSAEGEGSRAVFCFFFPYVSRNPCLKGGLPIGYANFGELLGKTKRISARSYLEATVMSAHQGEWEADIARDCYLKCELEVEEGIHRPENSKGKFDTFLMKTKNIVKLALTVALLIMPSSHKALASEANNPIFGYTHLLPSPLTLPEGRLVFGTDIAYGVTDFLQLGTGILMDLYQFYNANGKVSLVDFPEFAMALTLGWENYNYRTISQANPDLRVNSWLPGMVTGYELLPRLALFIGGNANITNVTLVTDGIATSGYVQGASVESDVSWAYNPPGKKRSVGNVLSAGISYDINYRLLGFGFSHHWTGFHIGIHYYPGATQYAVKPVLVGGGSIQF